MFSAVINEAENGFVVKVDSFNPDTGKEDSYLKVGSTLREVFSIVADAAGEKWDTKIVSLK